MPVAMQRTVPLRFALSPVCRALEIAVDDARVRTYLDVTYRTPAQRDMPVDRGVVTSSPHARATWNDEEILPLADGEAPSPWRTPLYLAEQLVWNSLALDEDWAALYGCAALVRGRAVVVAGETGAGKTTLADALASRSGGTFADEMLGLHRRDRRIAPIRCTAIVRPPTRVASNADHWALPGGLSGERYVRLPDPSPSDWPAPLGAVVLIAHRAEEPSAQRVSLARVALRLAAAIVRRRHDLDAFVAATQLFSEIPIVSLALGPSGASAEAVLEALQPCW